MRFYLNTKTIWNKKHSKHYKPWQKKLKMLNQKCGLEYILCNSAFPDDDDCDNDFGIITQTHVYHNAHESTTTTVDPAMPTGPSRNAHESIMSTHTATHRQVFITKNGYEQIKKVLMKMKGMNFILALIYLGLNTTALCRVIRQKTL